MAETRKKRYERRRSRRRRLQERVQHAVQRADAAVPRHGRAVLLVPVQQLGGEGAESAGHEELSVAGEPARVCGPSESSSGLS